MLNRLIFFIFAFINIAQAHVGDQVFPIFELTDEAVAQIDLKDGQTSEWEMILGPPNFLPIDFVTLPQGEGAPYDPSDLDYRIWWGWHATTNRIYIAIERIDNVHTAYMGEETSVFPWSYDIIEFLIDGDHTGGQYNSGGISEEWEDCPTLPFFFGPVCHERALFAGRQAQQFLASASAPDGQHVWYFGAGNEWVTRLPYADGGGESWGIDPTTTVIEFFVTPFDDLIYNRPDSSQVSTLFPGKVFGFSLTVADYDTEPGALRGVHILSGQLNVWMDADDFVDGILVGPPPVTSVQVGSWARIKASFR